jgi:hypothetical protein
LARHAHLKKRLLAAVVVASLALAVVLAGVAGAAQTVRLRVGFAPDRPGARTTIHFGFTIDGPGGSPPSPLTSVNLHLPAHLGLVGTTLGLASCDPEALLLGGPRACPTNSRVGYGLANAEVPYGPEIVKEENVSVNAYYGAIEHGRITVIFFAEGWEPVYAAAVFPGELTEETGRYSGSLHTTIPLIPSVPEGPDVSVSSFSSTLGPQHLTYYHHRHGRLVPFHPRGVAVPRHCPPGGYPFAADFSFQDGTRVTAHSAAPCPRR